MRRRILAARVALAAFALALGACAGTQLSEPVEIYAATLSGERVVPPVATGGRGAVEARFDHRTSLLEWQVTHSGLSGPVTMGHIHGPAGPEQNAPVLIPFGGNLNGGAISGQLRLTPEQHTQLESGQWYVNLHTARHPQGEVRGQLRIRRD